MTGTPPFEPGDAAAAQDSARQALDAVLGLLDLEPVQTDVFRGLSPKDRSQRVFGGQVLGQALVAATRTVANRSCHSFHAYFLRPGDPKVPILYEVDRSRDGASFSARRVVAIQHGKPIFTMASSFQMAEEGLEHQVSMPDVPAPETLKTERQWRTEAAQSLPESLRPWFLRQRPIEMRVVEPADIFANVARPPRQTIWVRAVSALPNEQALHQCLLAYTSDMSLLETSLLPHGFNIFSPALQLASLDHAMWFHRPFRADEWLLYVHDSPAAAGGRGFNRGMFFGRDGVLVASVAQEGLVRLRKTT